ncbi:hypothetical protein [Streptomyces hokutonensis]|uniref:Uncharacterized protein n=1 Tax=Streptomyces hokutonensis TaxID=1306990 RepID=A0ABW6LZC3_9ACTN
MNALFVGLVGALLGAAATLLAAVLPARRLRLRWYSGHNTTLLSTTDASLSVAYGGAALGAPRVVELTITNPARRDVLPNTFLNANPLIFDFHIPIVAILGKESSPASRAAPNVNPSGTCLELGPDMLSAKQSITYKLLLDGPKKDVKLLRDPFAGVNIKKQLSEGRRATLLGVASAAGSAVATLVLSIVVFWTQQR